MLRWLRSTGRMNLQSVKVQRRKKKFMLILLAAKPQAAKVKATVHGKCSVKIEKALSLYSKII